MSSIQFNQWNRMPRGLKAAVWMGLGIIALSALALLCGWVIQFLWNVTLAEMFSLPDISFWQALGVFVLAKLLFGFGIGGGSRSSSGRKKRKADGTERQQAEDPSALVTDDEFQRFWEAEGKAAWDAYKSRTDAQE